MAKIKVEGFKCERCGHIWAPRRKGERPARCPGCGSALWDRPSKPKELDEKQHGE